MLAEVIADGLIAYAVAGLVFACVFVVRGAGLLDPAADRSGWAFRLMIVPGSAALWPLLLARFIRVSGGGR
jgi:hypothetical protein